MRRPLFPGLLLALAGAWVGCTAEPVPASSADAPNAALQPVDAVRGEPVVLDERGDLTLRGHIRPVLGHTDEGRVVLLDEDLSGRLGEALSGMAVIDARFVGFGAVVIDEDHELLAYDEAGQMRRLDGDAYGPLTVAAGAVAYTRGSPPDLELARAQVRNGLVEQLTHGMAPVWSPALADDGRAVVFASGVAGVAQLHHLDASGSVAALPVAARIPSAPTAPLWDGEQLTFEDEQGVVALDLSGGLVLEDIRGAHGLMRGVDGQAIAELDGARLPIGGAR